MDIWGVSFLVTMNKVVTDIFCMFFFLSIHAFISPDKYLDVGLLVHRADMYLYEMHTSLFFF